MASTIQFPRAVKRARTCVYMYYVYMYSGLIKHWIRLRSASSNAARACYACACVLIAHARALAAKDETTTTTRRRGRRARGGGKKRRREREKDAEGQKTGKVQRSPIARRPGYAMRMFDVACVCSEMRFGAGSLFGVVTV